MVIIMRHFAFPLFVATSNEAGRKPDCGFGWIIPDRVVSSARSDAISIVIELHAASQSITSTAATRRASEGGDNISASFILLALPSTPKLNAAQQCAAPTCRRKLLANR